MNAIKRHNDSGKKIGCTDIVRVPNLTVLSNEDVATGGMVGLKQTSVIIDE